MRRIAIGAVVAIVLGVGSAPGARAQGGDPWEHLLEILVGDRPQPDGEWRLVMVDDGASYDLRDVTPPQDFDDPAAAAQYPPIVDIQQGAVVRFGGDLSTVIGGTPCAGGAPSDTIAFGCPTSPIDPALFAEGAFLFGTQLGEPLPDGGLPPGVGFALFFTQPDGTPYLGPWPYGGVTDGFRFVPGEPVERYSIAENGVQFVGPADAPVVFLGVEGQPWLWTVVPVPVASTFTGVQFHAFVDNSLIADTIPGVPDQNETVAPFDPASIGTIELVEQPPEQLPSPPVDEVQPRDEDAGEAAAPVAQDESADEGSGSGTALAAGVVAAILIGAVAAGYLRHRWWGGPRDEVLLAATADEDDHGAGVREPAREQPSGHERPLESLED